MGKREIGQLSIFDMAVFFVISDLFSLSVDGDWSVLLKSLVVAATMTFLQIITSLIILKFSKLRVLVEHEPNILIMNGKINQATLKKQRYNIDDLMSQLRLQGFTKLEDVKYAILETNGELSFLKKDECECFPFPLIKDGVIDKKALNQLKISEQWLFNELKGKKVEDVFLGIIENNKLTIIDKAPVDIKQTHKDMNDYSN